MKEEDDEMRLTFADEELFERESEMCFGDGKNMRNEVLSDAHGSRLFLWPFRLGENNINKENK